MSSSDDYERTIVVGDIHGCFDEFKQLLDAVHFSNTDLLVSVGDFVDRGPSSLALADFFQQTPNALSVQGNHERRLVGVIRGSAQPAWTQSLTLSRINSKDHERLAGYLESLPAVIETRDVIITHARLDPARALHEQNLYHTCAVGGAGVHIETDKDGFPLWFHQWETCHGVTKPICMGHIGYQRVELVPGKLYALDTAAVDGGRLTALILPGFEIQSIACPVNHLQNARLEWSQLEFGRVPIEQIPIHKVLHLESRETRDLIEQETIDRFRKHLAGLRWPERAAALKEKFLIRFGPIPPPGPSRGQYFIGIREQLPPSESKLIGWVLASTPFKMDEYLRWLSGKNLIEADGLLHELEENLK